MSGMNIYRECEPELFRQDVRPGVTGKRSKIICQKEHISPKLDAALAFTVFVLA